jgi:hypothetical protein
MVQPDKDKQSFYILNIIWLVEGYSDEIPLSLALLLKGWERENAETLPVFCQKTLLSQKSSVRKAMWKFCRSKERSMRKRNNNGFWWSFLEILQVPRRSVSKRKIWSIYTEWEAAGTFEGH